MQLFQQPFDANTVKPNEAFEPLPAGWYNGKIIASEVKPTKANDGAYLQLEIEIIDGDYKGRKVFDRLNMWCGVNMQTGAEDPSKAQTREIAHRQLSAYCHATGVFILQDSNQLHGIPVKIKVAVRTQEGYDPSNDVKAVKHIQDATPATSTTAPGFMAPQPQAPAPFGMNPSLPAQPAPAQQQPQFAPPQAPTQQPSFSPFGPPAMPTQQHFAPVPAQPTQPTQQTQWTPPSAPAQQPAPTGGPVPPWRK